MEDTEAADLHTHGKRKQRIYRERRFSDLKLFEPKTMCPLIAVRDREEREPVLVWPCGSRSI